MKKTICLLLCLILAISITACGESKEYQQQLFAMNTTFTITAYGKKAKNALNAAAATIVAIDAMCDPNVETSTCYALNHAEGAQINVSGQIAEMLTDAKEIYERTDGVYDITVYPLVDLWGFTDGRYYVPLPEEISQALGRLCMDRLTISKFPTSGTSAVTFPDYGALSFDSCARG